MVNRPPFDRDPPPGGFDPRFGSQPEFGRSPPPRPGGMGEPARDSYVGAGRGPDPFDHRQAPPPPVSRSRGMGRSTRLALILGGLLLLGAILFAMSLTRGGPGSDALDSGNSAGKAAAAEPEDRCAAPATYDRIKRELFRQAAAARGSDLAAFDRLAPYAALRVSNPVLEEQDEGLERVSCSGDVALDLPPGVQVVGGRRTLSARLGYSLQPAADGSGDVVTLSGAEAITVPLATLARVGQPTGAPLVPPQPEPGATPPKANEPAAPPQPAEAPSPPATTAAPPPAPRPAEPPAPPRAEAPPTTTASARPSFNCARASNRVERAICSSSELAALDRQMSSRYFASLREANATQRALLERTRGSFLAFRNRCGSDSCIADAYRGRIREIADIMADRWVAPR
jgi:uncharacterized protein YecT (DUF1311 family)